MGRICSRWTETVSSFSSTNGFQFFINLLLPEEPCVLFYYFIIDMGDHTVYYGNNPECLGGPGSDYPEEPPAFQITVYRNTPVPRWYKDGIVYQIFPDRFARSEDFDPEHVGTLPDVRGGVARCVEGRHPGKTGLSPGPWRYRALSEPHFPGQIHSPL